MTQFFTDQDTLAWLIIGVLIAISLIIHTLMKLWPFLSKVVTMVNGFVGYGNEPGVLDRIKSLEENSEQERNNHEKMSQQFDRVEAKLEILTNDITESKADRQRLWAMARKHHQGEIEE